MILTVILSFQWAVASAFYLPCCKTVSAHEDVRNSGRCSWWLKFSRSFPATVNMLLGRTGAPDTSSVEVNIRTCRSGRDEELNTQFPLEEKRKNVWSLISWAELSSPILVFLWWVFVVKIVHWSEAAAMLSAQSGDASFEQTAGEKPKKEIQNTRAEPARSQCTYEFVRNRKIKG